MIYLGVANGTGLCKQCFTVMQKGTTTVISSGYQQNHRYHLTCIQDMVIWVSNKTKKLKEKKHNG